MCAGRGAAVNVPFGFRGVNGPVPACNPVFLWKTKTGFCRPEARNGGEAAVGAGWGSAGAVGALRRGRPCQRCGSACEEFSPVSGREGGPSVGGQQCAGVVSGPVRSISVSLLLLLKITWREI